MTFNQYQEWTRTTAKYPITEAIAYCALGLTGEAGEVANNVKKEIRDGVDKSHGVLDELGDVLWYVARLSDEYGFTLDEVVGHNVEKLTKRHA